MAAAHPSTVHSQPKKRCCQRKSPELASEYLVHVVCAWIGNSAPIAARHYLQVTEADFRRAAICGATEVQNAVQQPAALSCMEPQEATQARFDCGLVPEDATCCKTLPD